MAQYKEIVTKAVIGKGKKTFKNKYSITVNDNIDTVLGCWVINHNLFGNNNNGTVLIQGSFDVNIWYSYDNNTKTSVVTDKINYVENAKIKLKDEATLTDNSEIIIKSLRNPNCVDVNVSKNTINYEIEKELGVEIIGDTKVRIIVEDDEEEYDVIEEEVNPEEVNKEIDEQVEETFLNSEQ